MQPENIFDFAANYFAAKRHGHAGKAPAPASPPDHRRRSSQISSASPGELAGQQSGDQGATPKGASTDVESTVDDAIFSATPCRGTGYNLAANVDVTRSGQHACQEVRELCVGVPRR